MIENIELDNIKDSIFEDYKKLNEYGQEYWSARDFFKILDYIDWRKFLNVIDRAKEACKNSGQNDLDHFVRVDKLVEIGSGDQRNIGDFHLSRYACSLIVQNADPSKRVVALGQTYFAIQTRKQEIQNSNEVLVISQKVIEERIFRFRNCQVMIDRDLAEFYGVETKRLNEQVKRNIERFPDEFRFQLTAEETNELVANCDRFRSLKHSSFSPYAFTEQGVAMLSAVLRSETSVKVSIQIINAFVGMRRFLLQNAEIFQKIENIEINQKEYKIDSEKKFDILFEALDKGTLPPKQGIFYDGQIFDAYALISDIIRTAKQSIIIIDNYSDDTVLTMLTKRNKAVKAVIYTKIISKTLAQDLKKHNCQYDPIEIKELKTSHDRFMIIDNKEVYHFGASLKDAGKKWFAFSVLEIDANDILCKL